MPSLRYSVLLIAPLCAAQEYVISTFAGGAPPAAAAKGVNLSIGSPQGIALDTEGNIYFTSLNCVFKQDPHGVVTRIAGTTRPGYSGDGGPASIAELDLNGLGFGRTGGGISPAGVAVDRAGNVYVADTGNHRIRRISPDGVITTVAGDGAAGSSGDGGPAVSAQLQYPSTVAVDRAGNLFLTDGHVRRVSLDGTITTVTRNEVIATAIAVDDSGNLYIADEASDRVQRISPGGVMSTVAGRGRAVFNCTPNGDGGRAIDAQLCDPAGVTVDSAGNLFFADTVADFDGDFRQIVRKVSPNGTITTVAGVNCLDFCPPFAPDGAPATQALLTGALSLAADAAGGLFIADPFDFRVRRVAADGIITTVAGGGAPLFAGEGGAATRASLLYPSGVAADETGNVFIADTLSNRIYKVSLEGTITTAVGGGPYDFSGDGPANRAELAGPYALAVDGAGSLFFIDGAARVRRMSPDGMITTVAGYGGNGDEGDGGPAILGAFRGPSGVTVDGAGHLFILDGGNGKIREVSPDGIINTVAVRPYVGRIAADKAGNLLIAAEFRIWKLSPGGSIAAVAGTGEQGFSGDGGPATEARLSYPAAVALDSAGNVFIADCAGGSGGCRIRKVSPDGIITTIAGDGTSGSAGDGGPARKASISWPAAIAVDDFGSIYLADPSANLVRVLRPSRFGNVPHR